jgi:putative acyl-CoA dehydrogenase
MALRSQILRVHEALECHGRNGFVEEGPITRFYREVPLNGIWEGSGNIIVLDVLRAAAKTPESVVAFLAEVRAAKGGDQRLDRAVDRLEAELSESDEHQARARRIVEKMAVALQASLLIRYLPSHVSDAFCAARLDADGGAAYGILPAGFDQRAIVERAQMGI